VKRDAIGSIRSTQGFVIDTTQNTGGLQTSGVDISVGYRTGLDTFGIQNMGSVSASFVGTYLNELKITAQKGGPSVDCAGFYGTTCSGLAGGASANPNAKWRHKLRVTWNTPFEYAWMSNVGLSMQWRYFASTDLDATSSETGLKGNFAATDAKLGARGYLDLLATFKIKDNYSFRFGVNNVLDNDPPLTGANNCPAGPCNQNVYAQMYDSLGRFFFMGVTADF